MAGQHDYFPVVNSVDAVSTCDARATESDMYVLMIPVQFREPYDNDEKSYDSHGMTAAYNSYEWRA